jgi:galactokinase
MQVCVYPQPACEPLPLPAGISIVALRTSLNRPVSAERLVDTCLCAEMGHRVLQAALNGDGRTVRLDRLTAITPTEFVDRYREIIPSRMTGKQFVAKFGEVRGLNGTALAPNDIYKIRSRAEHHIYENRRVHEFATAINRARRANSLEPLVAAGELMYASHWSHSQRCGIGGVETDRIVSSIRKRGPADGLYGAKVTGGGFGGEMVVLLRNDPHSHAALNAAIEEVQSACQKSIHTYRGSLAGAEFAAA